MQDGKPKGRPPKPADERLSEMFMLRLAPGTLSKLLRLGGAEWLRDRIKRAKEPDKTE